VNTVRDIGYAFEYTYIIDATTKQPLAIHVTPLCPTVISPVQYG